jgi:uncharacterized protein with PIN domain
MAKNKEKQEKAVQPEKSELETLLPETVKDTASLSNVVSARSDKKYENTNHLVCPSCGGTTLQPVVQPEFYRFRTVMNVKQLYRCDCCQKVSYHKREKDV